MVSACVIHAGKKGMTAVMYRMLPVFLFDDRQEVALTEVGIFKLSAFRVSYKIFLINIVARFYEGPYFVVYRDKPSVFRSNSSPTRRPV